MRKLSLVTCLVLLLSLLTGCVSTNQNDAKYTIVCTIFPMYDWVCNLTKDIPDVDVKLLAQNGEDLHSYQPSVKDMVTIQSADVFCYVGGESDNWVGDALEVTENPNRSVVALLDITEAYEEEVTEGMQGEEEESDEVAYDEHVWLSLRQSKMACEALTADFIAMDSAHTEQYQKNLSNYTEQLEALDAEFTALTEEAAYHTILVADRFPFRYLAEDYHLNYYAAFSGCSADSEASFSTITFLADKLQSCQLPCILRLDTGNDNLADTILECANEDCPIVQLSAIQSVTGKQLQEGVSYLSEMRQNLESLKIALEG